LLISHKHKFIFFAVPKTATHAVREVLRERAGRGYWEQQILHGEQVLPIDQLARIRHGHLTVTEAEAYLPQDIWRDYEKFAVVRNPFDRFVSACAFLTRGSSVFGRTPRRWMKAALQRQQFRQRVLIRPQVEQLCDDRGLIAMDHLVRYESLQTSLNDVLRKLGLETATLQRRNVSQHAAWQTYFDDDLREQVSALYQSDLDCFNYRFDS